MYTKPQSIEILAQFVFQSAPISEGFKLEQNTLISVSLMSHNVQKPAFIFELEGQCVVIVTKILNWFLKNYH